MSHQLDHRGIDTAGACMYLYVGRTLSVAHTYKFRHVHIYHHRGITQTINFLGVTLTLIHVYQALLDQAFVCTPRGFFELKVHDVFPGERCRSSWKKKTVLRAAVQTPDTCDGTKRYQYLSSKNSYQQMQGRHHEGRRVQRVLPPPVKHRDT